MAMNNITLAGGMRDNLANLQSITDLLTRTSNRMSTGLRVASAIDDPSAFFAAQSHRNRAADLATRKDAMGEALQTVKAASDGIDAINSLIQQAKGLAADARSGDATTRASLAADFDALLTQIDDLAGDSGYNGRNFLSSDNLTVSFNEGGTSALTISGFDGSSSGLSIGAAANAWVADTDIDGAVDDLNAALTTLRSEASTLSANNGIITTRQSFTTGLINTLTDGADQLTVADLNEEAANMLALQSRQQLGIVSLSLTNQSQQSILRLF